MNSRPKTQNFYDFQLQSKAFIEKGRRKQEARLQTFLDFFKNEKSENLFDTNATISSTIPPANSKPYEKREFSFFRLNLKYLRHHKSGLFSDIDSYDSRLFYHDTNLMYTECYFNSKDSYMIIVIYYFKQVKLFSENGKTNIDTLVFVNSKSEIYYDDSISYRLLFHWEANMDASYGMELLSKKQFQIIPTEERTYQLISDNDSEWTPKNLKEITSIPEQLFSILLSQNQNTPLPQKSKLAIETYFLGTTETPITVQSKVMLGRLDLGIMEVSEKLLIYEWIAYFKDSPEKRVKAKFYLTSTEKNQYSELPQQLLRNVILESSSNPNEPFAFSSDFSIYLEDLYLTHFIKNDNEDCISNKIANIFHEAITLKGATYEHPALKDTFQKVYVETFHISPENLSKEFPWYPIRENRIEYHDNHLMQSCIYAVIYLDALYLVNVYTVYKTYTYGVSRFFVKLPVFDISEIQIKIQKISTTEEFEQFIQETPTAHNEKSFLYEKKHFYYPLFYHGKIRTSKMWEDIFEDFIVVNTPHPAYSIEKSTNSDTLYQNILNCIQNPTPRISNFRLSAKPIFNYNDDTSRYFSLSSNGIIYGHFLDFSNHNFSINSSLTDNDDNIMYSRNDFLSISYPKEVPQMTRKTLYELLKQLPPKYSEPNIQKSCEQEIWKICIDFLLQKQDEIFSE